MAARRLVFAVCIAAALSAGNAQAQSQGVYWRVDTGYSWAGEAEVKDKNSSSFGYICGNLIFMGCLNPPGELDDVGESWIAGVGVGYRFTPRLRADVTFSYRAGFELEDSDKAPSSYSGNIASYNVMVNGYVDFPLERWPRVVPYVGAGIGYANNKIGDITNWNLPPLPPGISTLRGGSSSSVAWQLSVGASIALTPKITLDVAYRYLDSGKIETNAGNVTGFFAQPYDGVTGYLHTQELQVGLRF